MSDGTSLELDMDIVLEYTLKKGMELNDELLEEIESRQAIISAKQDAYNYASYRLRSEWQVRKKLEGKRYPQQLIDSCIDFLREFGLIDDEKFAAAYIKDTLLKKKDGPIKIKMKLRSFGVDEDIANNSIKEHYPFGSESDFAYAAAEKKMRLISGKSKPKQKSSLINHLQSKGFTLDVVKSIVDKIIDSE
jgi:regulatory protein